MKEGTIRNILAEELFGTRICESVEDQEILETFYSGLKPVFEKFLWGEPISVEELRKLLRKSIVNFEFIKLDGEVRPARGTTMLKYIPKEDQPKGIRPSSDAVATFFDMDKEAWRSVSKKSKEIVLKKDQEKDRPIVVVKDKEEGLKKKGKEIEKIGPEPEDELNVGDIRYYLNRNNRDIVIRITRM
ncbi:MAG TPA: SH3 beta-barrel fold-containing protein, partial [Candidatus Paceibacterota bacterium]|nr:SH3 beta-barrel fold-containing protein [Candidatus Paceibacterota bacterium]